MNFLGHFKAFLFFSKYDWMAVILCCLWWCAFVAFVEIYNSHSQDDFNRALVCSIIKLGSNLIFSLKQCKCHVVWHVIKCNSVRAVVHNVLRQTMRLYQKRFVYIIVPASSDTIAICAPRVLCWTQYKRVSLCWWLTFQQISMSIIIYISLISVYTSKCLF